jgi:hypothetical protein
MAYFYRRQLRKNLKNWEDLIQKIFQFFIGQPLTGNLPHQTFFLIGNDNNLSGIPFTILKNSLQIQ